MGYDIPLPADKQCLGCGELMRGINNYDLRKRCDACGGNKTKYNGDNPNPSKGRNHAD